ncbi:DUF805 domain-containing protein [Microbacterium radiodurans]|uniref:DUF805 domain-containing protein n=1 Tax=Microbacterium radiodurans TaxID=661398 RepID=A0A5J5IY80_9MICO|nr:DUF805 domain-containing protein [Microbacterium radiodurans]KAA9089785.1 DUF805 domain-containing protein [Microbacterium radiodurans]
MEAPSTAPLPGASLREALARFARHAFRLRGRASRSEYWWWMLVSSSAAVVLLFVVPALLDGRLPDVQVLLHPFGWWTWQQGSILGPIDPADPASALVGVYLWCSAAWWLVTIVPGFTVAVRRLHDSNLSGWWTLLFLLPAGGFVLLLLALRRSRPEGARFDGTPLTPLERVRMGMP